MNRVEKARRAAGITQDAAAAIIGVSCPTYIKKERNPSLMTYGEMRALAAEMDSVSRSLLWEAQDEVEGEDFDGRHIDDVTLGEYCGLRGVPRLKRERDALKAKFF